MSGCGQPSELSGQSRGSMVTDLDRLGGTPRSSAIAAVSAAVRLGMSGAPSHGGTTVGAGRIGLRLLQASMRGRSPQRVRLQECCQPRRVAGFDTMDADERRQQPLPVKLWNDERIGGDGKFSSSAASRKASVRSVSSGAAGAGVDPSPGRGSAATCASSAARMLRWRRERSRKTRGGERRLKRVKDGGVMDNLDLLLTQEQVEELAID